jgi:hypothetical protein
VEAEKSEKEYPNKHPMRIKLYHFSKILGIEIDANKDMLTRILCTWAFIV